MASVDEGGQQNDEEKPSEPNEKAEGSKNPPEVEVAKNNNQNPSTISQNAQKPLSPQKTISAITTISEKVNAEENFFKIGSKKCGNCISSQCGLGNTWFLTIAGLVVIILLVWALLFSILHWEVAPGGDLFKLLVLIIVAFLAGKAVSYARVPPLLGMLVAGIILRTVGFFVVTGVYLNIVIKLRETALTIILIKAGLGVDGPALLKLSFVVIRLAIIPCVVEAVAAAVFSNLLLGYPWLWGLMLGFMLSAVSPAVVVPVLLSLKDRGYGESKGIATLVIAASSLDDIVAISLFGIIMGILFSSGDFTMQVMQGPLEMIIGTSFGVAWGMLSGFVPHRDDKYVVVKRSVLIGIGGLAAVLGSEMLHYPGAGPLACIIAAFVGSHCWKMQGWTAHHPVTKVFNFVWLCIQPVLFGLIGAEIDLLSIDGGTVGYGILIICGALFIRACSVFLVLMGGKLNWKEMLFVNLAWLPKATVQAALGPQPLDSARQYVDSPTHKEDMIRGTQLLTIAVISILLTAPIGSVAITLTGPMLLSNEPVEQEKKDIQLSVIEEGGTTTEITKPAIEPSESEKVGTRV